MHSAKSSAASENKRVLMAMSGGVDSSAAAGLLLSQGYEVIGVHMQLWDHGASNWEREGKRCCSLVDAQDARRVCERLGIPYYVIDAQAVFREKVVDYFIEEYLAHRTPNPCVQCNHQIKFNYLFDKADELGCQWVATGHYAQIAHDEANGRYQLLKAADSKKDQSYYLFGLTQAALKRTLMPLGAMNKTETRELATQWGLINAQKPDSQEICFIGKEGYAAFIEKQVGVAQPAPGVVKNHEGEVIGQHEGLHRYTVGQRKGVESALSGAIPVDHYVIDLQSETKTLVVGPEKRLYKKKLHASRVNWVQPSSAAAPLECKARIRSRHEEAPCQVIPSADGSIEIEFSEPQRAITPGQAIVFYRGDEVLGGAFIDQVEVA